MTPFFRLPEGIALRPFDPHVATRAQWQQLHAYRRLRTEEDYPDEPLPLEADFERQLLVHQPLFESQRIMAVYGDTYVGNVLLTFRREGSPDFEDFAAFADAGGGVPRAHRRQAIATALLAAVHAFMRSGDRTLLTMKADRPEGHAWMAAMGAKAKYRSAQNRMPFAQLDWDALARWQEGVGTAADGLRWEIHAGRVPFERLSQLLEPLTALINEQPLDALEIPSIRYELEGYRTWYADMDSRGGTHFVVLLLQGSTLVAVCDVSWDARYPDRAFQRLTAVAGSWRGKGLAKAVKGKMLALVRQHQPGVRTMVTHNAHSNDAMLSINRRLGFAVHREEVTYQLGFDALEDALRARLKPVGASVPINAPHPP
jgi:GNAT superfamily N-acetyltransferase